MSIEVLDTEVQGSAKHSEVLEPVETKTALSDADVLRMAAHNIRIYGHAKQSYGSRAEGFCLVGAVGYAATGCDDSNAIAADHDSGVGHRLYDIARFPGGITRWNDAPERTAEQVIAALESAADALEA